MSKVLRCKVHGMFQKVVCYLLLLEHWEVWELEENETGKQMRPNILKFFCCRVWVSSCKQWGTIKGFKQERDMTTSVFQKNGIWPQYGRQVEGKPIFKKIYSKPRQGSFLFTFLFSVFLSQPSGVVNK